MNKLKLGSTENPGRLIARSCVTRLFAVAPGQIHRAVLFETTNKFRSGFIRADIVFRKRFSFITRVKKSSKNCIRLSVSSSFIPWNSVGAYYLRIPLHLQKNAMNTGFRGHKCNLGEGGRQAGGSPQYFFYLNNIFLLTTELKGVQ